MRWPRADALVGLWFDAAEELVVPVDGEDIEIDNPSMQLTFSTFRYVLFFTVHTPNLPLRSSSSR